MCALSCSWQGWAWMTRGPQEHAERSTSHPEGSSLNPRLIIYFRGLGNALSGMSLSASCEYGRPYSVSCWNVLSWGMEFSAKEFPLPVGQSVLIQSFLLMWLALWKPHLELFLLNGKYWSCQWRKCASWEAQGKTSKLRRKHIWKWWQLYFSLSVYRVVVCWLKSR